MARGQQKLQSQAKAQEKQAKAKKQQGHSATAQKQAAQKALVHACVICKVSKNIFSLKIFKYMWYNTIKYLSSIWLLEGVLRPVIECIVYIFLRRNIVGKLKNGKEGDHT